MEHKSKPDTKKFCDEMTLAAMDELSIFEIGRKTYNFVRWAMQDPELRAKIKARVAEIKTSETE